MTDSNDRRQDTQHDPMLFIAADCWDPDRDTPRIGPLVFTASDAVGLPTARPVVTSWWPGDWK